MSNSLEKSLNGGSDVLVIRHCSYCVDAKLHLLSLSSFDWNKIGGIYLEHHYMHNLYWSVDIKLQGGVVASKYNNPFNLLPVLACRICRKAFMEKKNVICISIYIVEVLLFMNMICPTSITFTTKYRRSVMTNWTIQLFNLSTTTLNHHTMSNLKLTHWVLVINILQYGIVLLEHEVVLNGAIYLLLSFYYLLLLFRVHLWTLEKRDYCED